MGPVRDGIQGAVHKEQNRYKQVFPLAVCCTCSKQRMCLGASRVRWKECLKSTSEAHLVLKIQWSLRCTAWVRMGPESCCLWCRVLQMPRDKAMTGIASFAFRIVTRTIPWSPVAPPATPVLTDVAGVSGGIISTEQPCGRTCLGSACKPITCCVVQFASLAQPWWREKRMACRG